MGNQGYRILFVDDEDIIVRLSTRQLEAKGFQVTGVTDGQSALDRIATGNETYHLLVTDLTMPGMSGLKLIESAKKLQPDLPVLIFSGMLDSKITDEMKALNVRGMVFKPVVGDELVDEVRRVLSEL